MMANDLFDPLNGFQSRKAAQIAASFAIRAVGKIEKLKLIKLIYLAERQFATDHDRPMLYDELYSLKDGPICSASLNGINGIIDVDLWRKFIARNGNIIIPVKAFVRDDFDQVSDAEMAAVEIVWNKFGSLTSSQLRKYTHDHCPEYSEVLSGRIPITYAEMFAALGSERPAELASSVEDFRRYEAALTA